MMLKVNLKCAVLESKCCLKIFSIISNSAKIRKSTWGKMPEDKLKFSLLPFQGEIEYLESRNDDLINENNKIRSENDELHEQIKDLESRYLHSLKRSASELERGGFQNGSSSNGADNLNGDIHTILKLSSKLQEVMSINETMAQTNCNLKNDIKCLRQEKQQNLDEIKILKEQQKLIDSPQRYNKYTVVALQTKADGYEREIKHLKKALKRSDEYIEKLTTEIETYKRSSSTQKSPNYPASKVSDDRNVFGTQANDMNNRLKLYGGVTNSFSKTMSSASATLQSLVRHNEQGMNDDQSMSKIWNPTQPSPKNSLITENIENSKKFEMLETNPKQDQALISNPSRFPACAKLLELSKQHDITPDKNGTPSPSSRSDPEQKNQPTSTVGNSSRHSSTPVSPSRSPVVNYSSSGRTENFSSPHNNGSPNQQIYQRENEADEITIVMPSTESASHWLQSTNQHGGRSSAERHVNSEERSSSPAWHQPSRYNNKTNGSRIGFDASMLSSKERGLFSPAKKIKTEVCYE
eukprot:TCONS_00054841-protein